MFLGNADRERLSWGSRGRFAARFPPSTYRNLRSSPRYLRNLAIDVLSARTMNPHAVSSSSSLCSWRREAKRRLNASSMAQASKPKTGEPHCFSHAAGTPELRRSGRRASRPHVRRCQQEYWPLKMRTTGPIPEEPAVTCSHTNVRQQLTSAPSSLLNAHELLLLLLLLIYYIPILSKIAITPLQFDCSTFTVQ